MTTRFTGSFTQQEPIPQDAIEAAIRVMRSGRLHRYNVAEGERSQTAALEVEFAAYLGVRYCLAVASGGYALGCALRALGVAPGAPVLTNAFTLAPVPGAIAAIGARPVFVESTESLTIDLAHLEAQAAATGAKVLMLSHMRGHQPDMEAVQRIARDHGLWIIEDCAHTMGGSWGGAPSGTHGTIACFSAQTYKHINSGEGGFLTTNDPELAARAVLLSGSYMLYDRHEAAPEPEVFERLRTEVPNISGRMDNLRAAILRPQLAALPDQVARWAALHDAMEEGLRNTPGLALIARDPKAVRVGSSLQFRLPNWDGAAVRSLVAACKARGVELKWFGDDIARGYTSRYDHWGYAAPPDLPQTDRVLAALIDMRLPLTFSQDDCRVIAEVIREEVMARARRAAAE
ncbi:MAG: DegT/DnrJ/EryC1/StrS family aminotransferase [Alphaproteobacteria bacterium]|nr:DegT/DnrJ/EryC1/StrS family aminotransferase [Alphaproteobacteria bacterium]NNF25301.1 aminotransferase [Paracoccaceae bacterium]